jgi:hypothetical protein
VSKRLEKPSVARHLLIFEEDWNFLRKNYQNLGINRAIRSIVHAHVKALRAKKIDEVDQALPGEVIMDEQIIELIGGVKE